VFEEKNFVDARKYCEENNGRLISLPHQMIVDRISESLEGCQYPDDSLSDNDGFITKVNHKWLVGLDCEDGKYKWLDGSEFYGKNYQPECILPSNELVDQNENSSSKPTCETVYLDSADKRLLTLCENGPASFLCSKIDNSWPYFKYNLILVLCLILFFFIIVMVLRKKYFTKYGKQPSLEKSLSYKQLENESSINHKEDDETSDWEIVAPNEPINTDYICPQLWKIVDPEHKRQLREENLEKFFLKLKKVLENSKTL